LPKDLENGDVLLGYVIFRDLDAGESVPDSVGKKGLEIPTSGIALEFIYTKTTGGKDASSKKGSSYILEDQKSAEENYAESIRQHVVDYISFLVKKQKFDLAKSLMEDALKTHTDYLPLLKLNVHYLAKVAEEGKGDHSAVIVAADRLISRIDANELALFYGTRHEEEDKSHDTKKEMLLTALRHKAKSQLAIYKIKKNEEVKQAFFGTIAEINKWAKVSEENKYAAEYIASERLRGNLGAALKAIKKRIGNSSEKEVHQEMMDVLGELGWAHWQENYQSKMPTFFPPSYTLF